jgi:hypothetical protein
MGREVTLSNNLIVGHNTGITVVFGMQAAWDYNGFYDNAAAYAPGLTSGTHDVYGDPRFANRAGADYHIGLASAMAGQGMDTGVSSDIDGDPRPAPAGTYPDLGADEVNQHHLYLPLALRSFQ